MITYHWQKVSSTAFSMPFKYFTSNSALYKEQCNNAINAQSHFNPARAADTSAALLLTHCSWNHVPYERSDPLTWAQKTYAPLTAYAMQTVFGCVCVNMALCVCFECVWAHSLQESAQVLNCFKFNKHCLDFASENPCVNCAARL